MRELLVSFAALHNITIAFMLHKILLHCALVAQAMYFPLPANPSHFSHPADRVSRVLERVCAEDKPVVALGREAFCLNRGIPRPRWPHT